MSAWGNRWSSAWGSRWGPIGAFVSAVVRASYKQSRGGRGRGRWVDSIPNDLIVFKRKR